MAFAKGTTLAITRPSGRNDFFVDFRRRVKIIPFTKLTGDTTSGDVDTEMHYVKAITVLKSDMSVDTAATPTTGFGSNGGNFTTSITNLSTGYTSGYLIVEGGKN
jgi:hypothetical protein